MDEPTSKLSPVCDLFLIGKRGVEQAKPAAGPIPKDVETQLPTCRCWAIAAEEKCFLGHSHRMKVSDRQLLADHWRVSGCASSTAKQISHSASSVQG